MSHATRAVSRTVRVATVIGAIFLVAAMLLVTANVVYRLFGHAVFGSFELTELMVVVTVAFALGYAALNKSHVVVDIVVSRFPERARAVVGVMMGLISLGVWAFVAWAGYILMSERWLNETTELLVIPLMPFRILWLLGLILFCAVYMMEIISSIKQVVKR